MNYKYQRRQIFGRRLKVPKDILNKVYNGTLSFHEFIDYQLDDKIPTSCMIESDRKIVEKFGVDKCKELDWELVNKKIDDNDINFRNILMSLDSQTDNINFALYELVKDKIKPRDYSLKMSKLYSDRLFAIPKVDYGTGDGSKKLKINFNDGKVNLEEIIRNWDLLKDKDLSYCLLNDEKNINHITGEDLRKIMSNYGVLVPLVIEHNDIYTFIDNLSSISTDEENKDYLKKITDDILDRNRGSSIRLTEEQYREIFKYSSIKEYVNKFYARYPIEELIPELQTLPEDYLFHMPIPFSELLNYDVLYFIGTYGLKNVVDFDNECGHFFTKNNCEMLKLMRGMYLYYSGNEHDPNKTIHTKKNIDENGNYIDRPYTKDEFYEAMKRMILYGPTSGAPPDYREIVGEFRIKNPELFISKQAPEELQKLFYTKSITPQLLLEHPEYIQYLNGKDLSSCFKRRGVKVDGCDGLYGYESIYKFLSSKAKFNDVINFITEYSDVLDVFFDERTEEEYRIKFTINDDMAQVKDRIHEALRTLLVRKRLAYPKKIPKDFIKKYPSMFLDKNAPQELQEAFYSRKISPEFLLSNPLYKKYLKNIDLDILFKYMLVYIVNPEGRDKMVNLFSAIEKSFGSDYAFDLILLYGKYIEKIYEDNKLRGFSLRSNFSKSDLLNKIDKVILQNIIDGNIKYDENIPSQFKNNKPTLFLDKNEHQELQEAFYSRIISSEFLLSNPLYKEKLKNFDLNIMFQYMPVNVLNEDGSYEQVNLFSGIEKLFGSDYAFDFMILYGQYIKKLFEDNKLSEFKFHSSFSKTDLLDEIDKIILQNIIDGNMKYDENFPSHFKDNNPTLFLDKNVPQEIKYKFYNREFTIKDFWDNPKLLDIFDNTNIAWGFPKSMAWVIPLFANSDNLKMANYNRMKVISSYVKLQDAELQNVFKERVMECETDIDVEKIEYISEVLSGFSLSNSSEIFRFRRELARQILQSNTPLENLNKIENIFIKNNAPTVGKVYFCFEILHPDFRGFNFENPKISPVLSKVSTRTRKLIVFSDLIKCSFGSNNRSVNTYLKNIELGSRLYEGIKTGQIHFTSLNETEKSELIIFRDYLETLYNNTTKAKLKKETFTSSGEVLTDLLDLSNKLSPFGTPDYNLADRVIRMFCGFTGIDTLEQAKGFITQKVTTADSRNRKAAMTEMTLEQGDFIKGIGDITYLRNILQNGSVSKEYLGSNADSDATPLDTDISMILSSEGTISEKMNATAASSYGPIWFVLKNDDRFITTRTSSETLETKRDMSKMEVFYTGVLGQGHYGIRTGFASSEINYIVMKNYDSRVGLEIAMNGFYIPVANEEGKIVFTPQDYDQLREKMSGLSYFGEQNYSFSENLVTEETDCLVQQIEQSNYEIQVKREKINNIIKKSLEELGLHFKTNIDSDLTEGFVEFIDTGSTGRGTNKPGDGDFDFMMRLDKTILSDYSRLYELKQTILKNLGRENSSEVTGGGDFRLKSVQIDNDTSVDIDITFTGKTDTILYSTDMALEDRLTTIQRIDPEKYKYVIANIILAKQVLKKAEVYKSNRGITPQGGLGGVGVENWILQHGGSFIDAAKSFVEAADGKSFSEFRSTYEVWDFGDNHLAEKRGQYAHDNFVANNMSEVGYQKMTQALQGYLKSIEISRVETGSIKR